MYTEFISQLAQHEKIAVIAHFRPDGDAIGSSLALGLALKAMGKQVRIFNEDPLPPRYAFLEGSDLFETLPPTLCSEISMVICVDCGAWKRLGDHAIELLDPKTCSAFLVNIDHHGSNEMYGQINIVQAHQAATGCMIAELIGELGVPMTSAMATALYVAINTDTGSFQYGSTTPAVMRTAADLMECGVDIQDVNRRLYQETPLSTLMVNREVLNHMVVELDGQLSHYSLDMATKAAMNLDLDDTKDLVEIIRVIEGVKASVIFEELDCGRIRMSLRSKDPRVDVSRVAAQFGGGGHKMAAGIRMSDPLPVCREKVLTALHVEILSQCQA